ncbi:MAG: flagellar transcriptional regulator FlhD [Gallionellaceae bacterium]
MKSAQQNEDIKEINLSYLLLARQMILEDKETAMFRLGLSGEMVELIAGLSPAQMLKMAASNMLLCRFRLDEKILLSMITDFNRERLMPQAHSAILMAGQQIEAMAA